MKTRKPAPPAPGQVSGFEILETPILEELDAQGVWARHKSGLEVFHVLNNDEENLFAFAFATASEDSTGAAHILEHSVLCGSENYPLKDTFLILEQGSLQTYLNAWTFPDKTVYPGSSTNEQDYFNLMAVYGDAVFRPLLTEWTFLQEGWRLAFSSPESSEPEDPGFTEEAGFTGVVYNEMQGAFSALDRYTQHWSLASVLPDTPYAFEAGGDPARIPDLTWEKLRDFHCRRYSPGNCRIFLAGNIPTEKQLAFIAEKLLPGLPDGRAAPLVKRAARWREPKTMILSGPAGKDRKSTVMISWLCGDTTDSLETLSLAALEIVLLGHDGSPLTRALIDSHLGEDIAPVTGFEGDLRETVFVVGLRGVTPEPDREKAVEAFIMGELRRISEEGIPPNEIEAALLALAFSHREFKRANGPWSLVWLQRSLRGWIHGAKPWDKLLFMPAFSALKERLAADSRYFESLIKKYLLDNSHRALVVVRPEENFFEKYQEHTAARIEKTLSELGPEGIAEIKAKAAALERFQEAEDPPEKLALIPHLSREDLSPEIDLIPRRLTEAGGIPVLIHDIFTNGITYIDLAFPLDVFEPEDYRWFPLFSKVVVALGLPEMDYGEVSSLMARTLGGFYAIFDSSSPVPGASRAVNLPMGPVELIGRDWLTYRVKALDEKIIPSLDVVARIILEADFTDLRRIKYILAELKNDLDSTLPAMGHIYASTRAGRRVSRANTLKEIWRGLSQFKFIQSLTDGDIDAVSAALTRIRDILVSSAGLIVNLTGSGGTLDVSLARIGQVFGRFGAPRASNPRCAGADGFYPLLGEAPDPAGRDEVYTARSLCNVGFAGMTLRAAPFSPSDQAVEKLLAHGLSTSELWEDIRMKGGAYGVFAHADIIESAFEFSTYRDPNPLRSLDAFSSALKRMGRVPLDPEFLEKAIIGEHAKETLPLSITDKSLVDFIRFLIGFEDRHRAERRKKLLAISADEIRDAASRLAQESPSMVIIADEELAGRAAAALGGLIVRKLV